MGTFVQDGTTFTDRTNNRAPTGVTTEIEATQVNTLKGAVLDLRDHAAGSVNVANYLPAGYVTDGSVDYATQIQAMVTTLGSTPVTVVVPFPVKVQSNVTIPSTATVLFLGAGAFRGTGTVAYTPWNNNGVLGAAGQTPPPAAPSIMAPANGVATNSPTFTVSGTADANTTTKLYRDGTLISSVSAGTFGEWSVPGVALTLGGAAPVNVTDDFSVDSSAQYTFVGTFTISAGRLHNNTTGNPDMAVRNSPQFTDGNMQATINNADWSKRTVTFRIRHTDANNAIHVQIDGRGAPYIAVYDNISGGYPQDGTSLNIGGGSLVNSTDYTFKVDVTGNVVSVWWNGVLLGTRTTAIAASGKAVLSAGTWAGQAAEIQFDNLVISSTAQSPTTSVFTATSTNANGTSGVSSSDTVVAGAPSATTVAALGDSITASPGFGGVTSWPEVLVGNLTGGSTETNWGVAGKTTADLLPTFESSMPIRLTPNQ